MKRLLIALALSIVCASAAQAFMLTAVVKDKDGAPKILGYGFGNAAQKGTLSSDYPLLCKPLIWQGLEALKTMCQNQGGGFPLAH
jgi:hypothetical protein